MILIVNICRERLHYFEFVKPIEDILKSNFSTKHYLEINKLDLEMAEKVIICGTSIRDDFFLNDLNKFLWIKDFGKPILGICAGHQIIGSVFGCKIKRRAEVGYFYEDFEKDFLGLNGKVQVYHLHNNYIEANSDFEVLCGKIIPQAIKHKNLPMYGVLFHPEVRNKEMILKFKNM